VSAEKVIKPRLGPDCFIAPGAWVMGDVRLGAESNVWYGCVLRGDINSVEVGEGSNIQDLSVLHVTRELPCVVGSWVTVGHRVILHGCVVEDRCLIGMGAIVLNEAVIGRGSVIGAGSVVTERTIIPPDSLVLGTPGKVVRTLKEGENPAVEIAGEYIQVAREHQQGNYPVVVPNFNETHLKLEKDKGKKKS
jgi:carbonic anhydrase/acetyltransferase-like protein (isoleucine patch superfamily)